jgi:hypothetical protein
VHGESVALWRYRQISLLFFTCTIRLSSILRVTASPSTHSFGVISIPSPRRPPLSLSSPPRNDPRANERNEGGKRAPFEKKLTSPSPSPRRRARPPDRRSRTTLCRRRPPPRGTPAPTPPPAAPTRGPGTRRTPAGGGGIQRGADEAGVGGEDREGRHCRARRPPVFPPAPPAAAAAAAVAGGVGGGGEDKCDKRRITCAR